MRANGLKTRRADLPRTSPRGTYRTKPLHLFPPSRAGCRGFPLPLPYKSYIINSNDMNFYLQAFSIFFKIGMFTIGGGYAMVPLIEEEVVNKRKWIAKDDFIDLLAISQTSPGILAVNISIFIGYRLKGIRGSIITALGTVLPSFLIILAIALFFHSFKDNTVIERIFKGIRPAVVALIAAPTFSMAKSAKIDRSNLWIPVVSALLIWLLGFSPFWIIIAAGTGGYIWGRIKMKNNTTKPQ